MEYKPSDFPQKIKSNYQFVKVIGKGTFGVVCIYEHIYENKYVAIKLEKSDAPNSTLTGEAIGMKKLNKDNPNYYDNTRLGY